jgi:hypothetical protein
MIDDNLQAGVRIGSMITLTDHAREWTKDRVFLVDQIHPWGVRCYTILDAVEGDGFHAMQRGKEWLAYYRAPWPEIGSVETVAP